MKAIKKTVTRFFGYVVLVPLAIIIPKDNYVVLITRFGEFEGNLKYLYLYFNSLHDDNYRFVFLTEKPEVYKDLMSRGFRVWYYPSLLTAARLLRTGLIIVDGNEWSKRLKFFLLFRSKKVQVWHGTGLKVIGLLRPAVKSLSNLRRKFAVENIYYDLLSLSSAYQVEKRSRAFRHGRVIINGLPRNDIFFNRDQLSAAGGDQRLVKKCRDLGSSGYKVVAYTPTWRQDPTWVSHFSLPELEDFAERHRLIVIIKLHPKDQGEPGVKDYKNIFEYSRVDDVYPLLTITDLLVTDYSSIYLDYLLTGRPVVFYPFDSESYIGSERELLIDYQEVTPGPICHNLGEVKNAIFDFLVEGTDNYRDSRQMLREKFFRYADGKSSERLWHTIKEDLLAR